MATPLLRLLRDVGWSILKVGMTDVLMLATIYDYKDRF